MAAEVLAGMPDNALADDRGITFAVDRFTSDVAYVAADRSVHVLDTGVPASAPTASFSGVPTVYPRHSDQTKTWNVDVALNRPVDAWQLTVTETATQRTAAVVTGGPARALVSTSWDGRMPDGSLAASGAYTWQVSATVQGTTAPLQGASGTVTVMCGTLPYRSYACNGNQAVLAFLPTSGGVEEGHWYHAIADGRLRDNGHTENWQLGTQTGQTSALVPFGDLNGDGEGDLLVRDSTGVLTAYLGSGVESFSDYPTVGHVRIGSGWYAYNLMLSVGDLNMDGHDDLVARDASGVLWFCANTGDNSFAPRVDIGTGWQAYNALIGVGDLSHDGHNDLVARDSAGLLWRYDGRGDGTFRPRVQIGTGWSSLRLY